MAAVGRFWPLGPRDIICLWKWWIVLVRAKESFHPFGEAIEICLEHFDLMIDRFRGQAVCAKVLRGDCDPYSSRDAEPRGLEFSGLGHG
jgi:hypothetical protein